MSRIEFTKTDNYRCCWNAAIYLLAMREHSRLEIYNKLCKKGYAKDVDLDELLDELEEKDYLNEERFAESFVGYRITRGQGSLKISNELRNRGISASLTRFIIQAAEVNWVELAAAQREKKFGKSKPIDFKEKARQMRFLSGRGFASDVIRYVVN